MAVYCHFSTLLGCGIIQLQKEMVAAETRCKIKEIKGEMKIADTYYVNVPYGETVNVRTEPSRQSPILFTLPRGTMVTRWGIQTNP